MAIKSYLYSNIKNQEGVIIIIIDSHLTSSGHGHIEVLATVLLRKTLLNEVADNKNKPCKFHCPMYTNRTELVKALYGLQKLTI